MKRRVWIIIVSLLGASWQVVAATDKDGDTGTLYQTHCASCHGVERLGGEGPALLPDNLSRLRRADAVKVIAEGRMATQMAGFADKLTAEQIKALADLAYMPPAQTPVWGIDEIRKSRIEHYQPGSLSNKPVFKADPLNLFVVVEVGDHHATILDGDKFEPIVRFPTRYALHGGPKFSPDGRYVYFASRDGWIAKYDIWNLKLVAEIRAGINTRNLAVSSDGRFAMAANYLPHTLVVLDTRDLTPIRVIEVKDDSGKSSRVSAVYDAAPRKSFVAALKDIPEVWELSYGDNVSTQDMFTPRRLPLEDYLDDFFFDAGYGHLVGSSRDGSGQVVNLDKGQKVASIGLPGLPHLGSGISFEYQGRTVMASPNLKEGVVTVIDTTNWQVIKNIKTLGPGFFMRSHENTPYAWVDVFNSTTNRDVIQLIDKQKLEIVERLKPSPGKIAAHTEFTRDGKYALVSIWEMDGALIVYDAMTLKEIKRIQMKKPSGKYNVYNKITRSTGTSH